MKRLVKNLYYFLGRFFFKARFRKLIRKLGRHTEVYLVDIDNTLAHTWPSLQQRHYSAENKRYRSLPIFIGMRSYLLEKMHQGQPLIFLSARSYLNYRVTCQWLSGNGLPGRNVILVADPQEKLEYITELLCRGLKVVYIDDLSHGHEFGNVNLYEDLILDLKALPVAYLGIKEISLINSDDKIDNQSVKATVPCP
ncbi:hypothetical protein PBAL39_01942 [Pedobacter sp. BAL39]|uniref:hypothetical protein n=1 Tax=Pedobacter sp. BAL39 TaxID=391596 RepID=UPI0001559B8C|nr:hypothetical protein [Pedobacter sp. BAL39]EDM38337.1 hypothetical protein PBAL39_01942 [Pedobacter sp. BAL39]